MKLAVVGGGPIGLVTALLLEKQGHHIDIFERGTWPRDKTCGQGLMPSGIRILESLGLKFELGEECYPYKGIKYIDGDSVIDGKLSQNGIGIERKLLSHKLIEKIKEKPNINLFANSNISQTNNKSDQFEITLENTERVYDYAFACDGLNSSLRKSYQNRRVRTGEWRLGAREHFNQAPWSDKVEVYWSNKVEAYVTPVSSSKIEVAFLWYEKSIAQEKNIKDELWSYFPELKEKIHFEKSQKDFRGHGPFSVQSKNVKVNRLFFLGDAYCFLDGITGEGMSLGMKGAQLVTSNFENWNYRSKLKFKACYVHYRLMVNLALMLSNSKRWRGFVFKFFKKIPKSFNLFLAINDS